MEKRPPAKSRGLIAALVFVVLALAGLCLVFCRDDRQGGAKLASDRPRTIRDEGKNVKPRNAADAVAPAAPTNLPLNVKRDHSELTREELLTKVPHWAYTVEDRKRVDPGYAKRHERFLKRQENNPWKTYADNALATLLFSDGELGWMPPFNANFKDVFLKSIQTPIIISKDDPPELQQQKRELIETKIWLKDQIDDGKDIVKILNDEYNKQKKVAGLRDNLRRELFQLQKTAKSVQEIDDYVAAANKMLSDAGTTKQLKGPFSMMTKIRLRREAEALQQQNQ